MRLDIPYSNYSNQEVIDHYEPKTVIERELLARLRLAVDELIITKRELYVKEKYSGS